MLGLSMVLYDTWNRPAGAQIAHAPEPSRVIPSLLSQPRATHPPPPAPPAAPGTRRFDNERSPANGSAAAPESSPPTPCVPAAAFEKQPSESEADHSGQVHPPSPAAATLLSFLPAAGATQTLWRGSPAPQSPCACSNSVRQTTCEAGGHPSALWPVPAVSRQGVPPDRATAESSPSTRQPPWPPPASFC